MSFAPGWGTYNSQPEYNTNMFQDQETVEFIEFAFQIMGIDMTFTKFKSMSPEEKKAFLRDIKINKILK